MPNTEAQSKRKRSRYVTFTYVFQIVVGALWLFDVICLGISIATGDKWVTFALDAFTFSLLFYTPFLWRAEERRRLHAIAFRQSQTVGSRIMGQR